MEGYVEYELPFCDPFICSRSISKPRDFFSEVNLWKCMPDLCKRNVHVMITVICMLSVFTTVFNLVVIAANLLPSTRRILRRSPTMQNYSNYVISLALADLLIGVVVMPITVAFFYQEAYSPRVVAAMNQTLTNDVTNENQTLTSATFLQFSLVSVNEFYVNDLELNENRSASNKPLPGTKKVSSDGLLHILGVVLHVSILVSVYTLAAASADRFYVSTKASRARGIRISRVSLRRLSVHQKCSPESCLTLDASRSTIIVFSIWIVGFILALSPFFLPGNRYQHIGHMFAAVSANDLDTLTSVWYIAALALPLAVIWIFSFLLWITLWIRKRKLERFSSSVCKQELREKKLIDKEVDSSFAFVSRCSNTETAAAAPGLSSASSSDHNITPQSSDGSFVDLNSNKEPNPRTLRCKQLRLKPKLVQSASLPCSRQRRPSSLDSSINASKINEKIKEVDPKEDEQQSRQKRFLKCYSAEESLPTGYMAKRILFRRSWEGPSTDSISVNDVNISKTSSTPSESSVASKTSVKSPPSTPSPLSRRKSASSRRVRTTPTRVRRQSSIFRAREFIMSNSFESNIARTLFAVVVVFTIAILPLLIAMLRMTPLKQASLQTRNKDLTFFVVAVAILLSNSFWNCFIYGIRMPYFRTAIMRIFRKFFRFCRESSCPNIIARKLSLNSSIRRNSDRNEPTWL